LAENYNDTQLYKFEEISDELISSATPGEKDKVYEKIASFTIDKKYGENNNISEYEAKVLVGILSKINNDEKLSDRVNFIMQNADGRSFKGISQEIVTQLGDKEALTTTDEEKDNAGFVLAKAIYNVEVANTDIPEAYEVLMEYKDRAEYANALIKLKNILNSDENIKKIVDAYGEGTNRKEIQEYLQGINY